MNIYHNYHNYHTVLIDLSGLLVAYLLGSVCTAIPVCHLLGLPDPRTQGSGNPGATNVLRVGGKGPALLTLSGDMLKAVIPVLIARLLHATPLMAALVGLAAFLGHLFPLFYHFQGGKGVATAFGVIWTLHPLLGLGTTLIWLLVFYFTRTSSLAALLAFGTLPLAAWFADATQFPVLLLMALLLFFRHHRNIRALLRGEERPFKRSTL